VTGFVLDVSVALAWCFRGEATPAAWAVPDRLETETAVVPSLWHLEAANVLVLAERKGCISAAGTAEFIAMVETFSIEIDQESPLRAFAEILALARRHGLTAYDAAYLEMAMAIRHTARHQRSRPGGRGGDYARGRGAATTVRLRTPWAPWMSTPSMSAVADGPVISTA
jgi:predicted nucleic acid-binding protein